MNCFGGLSNRFASEGCLIFYRNSVVSFREQKDFVLKTGYFYLHSTYAYVRESVASSISYAEIILKRKNSCRQELYYCKSPQVISTGSGILGDYEGLFSKNCIFKSKL